MICPCGYSFSQEALRFLDGTSKRGESYAVISGRDYLSVIQMESDAIQCTNEDSRLDAIVRSAAYVGTAFVCPQCARLLLLKPGTSDLVIYKPEIL